ncbi:MAG: Transcription termination factor Rho, partial [Acidimicrobiales bacterium]|nr:Transcription termination factor Rho [Acidimicrobiales bacterium]
MSVGQDFDRSLLERKERTELIAIAESLGEKPPSRAKKADIVDHILKLVNVDPGGSGSRATGATTRGGPDAGRPVAAAAGGAAAGGEAAA